MNWRALGKSLAVAALSAAVQQLSGDPNGQALLAAASAVLALWLRRPIDKKG